VARLRVEAGRGLVEQQQLGLVDERAGDREPSLHPTGKKLDVIPGPVFQLDELEELLGATPSEIPCQAEVAGIGDEVLVDVQLGVERVGLRHDPQARPDPRAIIERIHAKHSQGAGGGGRDAADHPHRRRFARAVRAEKTEGLAALDIEVDRVDRDELAEAFGQATGMDKRVCTGWRFCHWVPTILDSDPSPRPSPSRGKEGEDARTFAS
jgi:hypothetical protein